MEPFELPPEIFGQVPLFAEIAKAMSWSGGPVNWDIARQIATASARSDQSPPVIAEDGAELVEAARLTQAWLADATGLGDASSPPRVVTLTSQQWADRALSIYPEVIDPLAAKLTDAVSHDPGSDEMGIAKVMGQLVPLFLGIQVGSVIGGLSRTVLTGYDLPLPLEDDATISVVVAHVDAHAKEFGIDRREMRYWVTAHASALGAIFETLPWTRAHFFSLYHQYLAGIDVDIGEAMGRLQQMDISNPDALRDALGGGLFGFGDTPASGPALGGLHRYLALLDATAGRAVATATRGRVTSAGAIAESIARRSSTDDSAPLLERFLGIEVPPEVKQAALGFVARIADHGWPLIIEMWSDPERLPTEQDLRDPEGWIRRVG